MYASFADRMTTTVAMTERYLRGEKYSKAVEDEDGRYTFCPPCILKCLIDDGENAGKPLGLEEICNALELTEEATRLVQEIWESEYKQLYNQVQRARLRDSTLAGSDSERCDFRGVLTEPQRPHKRRRISPETIGDSASDNSSVHSSTDNLGLQVVQVGITQLEDGTSLR